MRPLALLAPVLWLASGCSLHAQTGKVMSSYAVEHVTPYLMQSSDVSMVCQTGVAMGAFLMSFERVTDPPDRAGLVTLMAAGMCAESEAWEAELAQLRAVRDNRAGEAQDARIREQRAHEVAAERYQAAYARLTRAFGAPGETCPKLEGRDELLYLLGLSSGLLAVFHDRAAGGSLGVPLSIPRAVAQAARCVDDARFWGVPRALQAAVWASVPGTVPDQTDPFAVLRESARRGQAEGVRLAGAFLVQTAAGAGKSDELRRAIKDHAESVKAKPAALAWRMLDRYATLMIEHESDKLWTGAKGHRTPTGSLGAFADDDARDATKPADDGQMLEGLEEEKK
ncbi:MAG TPA: hypothetical protein VGQ83_16770 [Polyangia bacterium]|jgi:hypothetical protein